MADMPRINEPAPDFHAKTTHGDRSLSDYRGKWLILFSHPSDCPTREKRGWCVRCFYATGFMCSAR
jgi:peroxiredoxin